MTRTLGRAVTCGFMEAVCLYLLVGLAFTLQATLGGPGGVGGVGEMGGVGGPGRVGVPGGVAVVRGLGEVGTPGEMGGLGIKGSPIRATGVGGRSWDPALGFRAQAGYGGTALLELILDTLHLHRAGHDRPLFGDGSRELVARDPGMRRGAKVKFLKHLTGPLRFSPECARYFQRILHGSRECGDPTYYRRCARLLTRLASSPPCAVQG